MAAGTTSPADATELGIIAFSDSSHSQAAYMVGKRDGGTWTSGSSMPSRLEFSTTADGASSPTERMRIDKDGRLFLYSTNDATAYIQTSFLPNGIDSLLIGRHSSTSIDSGTTAIQVFTNGDVLNINNEYGGISDIKLKENIVDAKSQWDDIKALRLVNYNFKAETGHQTHKQIGLIAQEVEKVSPALVGETKDTETVEVPVLDANGVQVMDEDGKPQVTTEERETGEVTKSIAYSVLYMKAVGALQEAMTRIETLEAEVASLKGGAN